MSLSNQDIENLKKRLNNNQTLSIPSKNKLNAFINNTKNAFDRTAYNTRMKNLRSKEPSLGKRKRSPDNLNSAMENNTGTVSGGSVNPNKNGRRSPRGPLSGISGASNTSNNGNNVSSSPNKKKARSNIPLITAALGAQRAIANANAKARANANARARANAMEMATPTINNNKNIEDVINLLLSKDQLIQIAKNLKISYKSKNSASTLRNMIMKHPKKDELKVEINKQVVGNNESTQITEKVNSYISRINNTNRMRPTYTASLVILYIKDLPLSERQKIIADGSKLPQLMNGINRRTISDNKINFEKNITREQFTDLVFIMWLDGVHDEYIKESLNVWFTNTTLFTKPQKELVVKGWKTEFIDIIESLNLPKKGINILKSSLTNYTDGWEKKVKTYLTTKYKSNINTISTSLGKQVTTNTSQSINIAIDQQYKDNNEYSISRFIKNHTRAKNSKTDVNTLITYGQAFDPGRSMVSGGVHQDIEMLTLNQLSSNFISAKKTYYLCDININLKVNNTSVYNLQVKKNSTNNVDVSFNSKKILTGISGGQAGKAKGDVIAVSKYFGDALQYYSLAVMDDVQRRSSKTERFFFGSGDSMALLGYDRVCEIFNKDIRMVIDYPTAYSPTIYVVGMNANVRNRPQPSASMMTGTGAPINNRGGEVTSSIKKRKVFAWSKEVAKRREATK
tara:strand:+ start:82 stop:2130 length:2049 start_codon:yes stop_codon:yes gene_type:complete